MTVTVKVHHPDWSGEAVDVKITIHEGTIVWLETPTGAGPLEHFSPYVVDQVRAAVHPGSILEVVR